MDRSQRVVVFIMSMAMLPVIAAGQSNNSPDNRGRRGYQEHDRDTRTSFTATTDDSGNAVLTLRGGDFALEKVVAHTGDATLRLSQGKDVVTIAISQRNGFQLARGQKSIRVDPRSNSADALDAVRSILLGSQAVRSFKRLVSALEQRDESEEDGPLAVSALVDGAIVQLLDGDEDAPRRIARRITRKHRAALRVVKSAKLPGVFVDCVGNYQIALMSAYGQYESCFIESTEYSWWSQSFVYRMCQWEWALRSQQYVWQFIGCFMLPW